MDAAHRTGRARRGLQAVAAGTGLGVTLALGPAVPAGAALPSTGATGVRVGGAVHGGAVADDFPRGGEPAHRRAAARSYALTTWRGRVPRWSACRPITVKFSAPAVKGKAARKDVRKQVTWAVKKFRRASGLPVRFRGRTREVPGLRGRVRSADVVIAFTTPRRVRLLRGTTLALGGSMWWNARAPRRSDGRVLVDVPGLRQAQVYAPDVWRITLLHELAHVAGLGHVNDPDQLMYPALQPTTVAAYHSGDRKGLRRLRRLSAC